MLPFLEIDYHYQIIFLKNDIILGYLINQNMFNLKSLSSNETEKQKIILFNHNLKIRESEMRMIRCEVKKIDTT